MTFGHFSIDYTIFGAIMSNEIKNDCWSYFANAVNNMTIRHGGKFLWKSLVR